MIQKSPFDSFEPVEALTQRRLFNKLLPDNYQVLPGVFFFNYPLNAATLSGMLRVWSGSMIPSSGLRALLAIPVLASAGRWSNTATPVVSLPVPEVVGTETNFRRFTNYVEGRARLLVARFLFDKWDPAEALDQLSLILEFILMQLFVKKIIKMPSK